MEAAEECRPLLTVNNHQGLYQYKRLVYGIASAPVLWQKAMDQVLPGTQCYIDDIIVLERMIRNIAKIVTKL